MSARRSECERATKNPVWLIKKCFFIGERIICNNYLFWKMCSHMLLALFLRYVCTFSILHSTSSLSRTNARNLILFKARLLEERAENEGRVEA